MPDPSRCAKAVKFPKRSHYPQKDPVLLEVIKKEVQETYMVAVGDHMLEPVTMAAQNNNNGEMKEHIQAKSNVVQ